MNTKKFTILHSNDMHGDILPETKSEKDEYIGGLALLSGYLNKVRSEEENVIYVIAGDMVQGSLIDSEFKGISTIEIMNYLSPDAVTLGNHEFDYGIPHLLFLEKMANFPIVNANLYIKDYYRRLMKPYIILKKAGFDFLITGIVTEKVIDSIKQDKLIGSFVSLEEASQEVGKITNAYKSDDIDLTILLTHIGFESDIELAKILNPEWGVDLIIGGHSHTVLDKPKIVNDVMILTAGTGTNQIGRLDIVVDDDTNKIVDYKWELVNINSKVCEPDNKLASFIDNYKSQVDRKYNAILCKFNKQLTHPKREIETSLGNYIADSLAEMCETDVMLVGSGSIRVHKLGPIVSLGNLMECFPYDDSLTRFEITGNQLKRIFNHIMCNINRNSEGECYQVNSRITAVHDDTKDKILSIKFDNKLITDNDVFKITLQGFHINNCKSYLGISIDELKASNQVKIISTSAFELLKEFFRNNQNPIIPKVGNRLIYK